MDVVYLVLWIFAFVCFVLAVWNVPEKINLVALGLAFATAVFLIQTIFVVSQ